MEQELRQMFEMKETEITVPSTLSPALRNRIGRQRMVMGGLIAAAAFALVIGGFAGARSLSNDAVPIPPADETEDKDPTVVNFPDLTKTFVSPTNGFSVKHPDSAVLTPAKAEDDWDPGKEEVDEGVDVVETGLGVVFKGASTEVPDGSIDDWVDGITPGGCGSTRSQQAKITIDGRPAWIAECPNEINAIVVAGDRVYLFSLLHDRSDARAVFDAFAATIDLTPESAIDVPDDPWEVVHRSNMTTTFVSPTNGYSFKYWDRGGFEPAKELWDPANQSSPIDDLGGVGAEYMNGFDLVETGYGAFFMSASTQIPDAVSVDEWIDASVAKYLPDGCYVPRSQQARITIDGQPGRILEDCEEVVATVAMDGRLYLFMMAHSGEEEDRAARAVFDAFAATIDLTPETAAVQ